MGRAVQCDACDNCVPWDRAITIEASVPRPEGGEGLYWTLSELDVCLDCANGYDNMLRVLAKACPELCVVDGEIQVQDEAQETVTKGGAS